MESMFIDVSKIRDVKGSSVDVEFYGELDDIGDDDRDNIRSVSPVRVVASATNTGSLILVKGEVGTELEAECSRCLTPFRFPLRLPFESEYCKGRRLRDEGCIPYEGDQIDIAPQVREAVILSLPMKFLCREDCKGLCPGCGENLNLGSCKCPDSSTDPRLGPLRKLLEGPEEGCKGVKSNGESKR